MKKIKFLIALLCCTGSLFAQSKFKFTDSEIRFFSEALLEDIEAVNKEAIGVIDVDANAFLFRVPVKGFRFAKKLMEAHFNENYLESHKYPRASFKGEFKEAFDPEGPATQEVMASGTLEIHGVTVKRDLPVVIRKKDGVWSLSSTFNVALEDHDIEIPTVVFNKIAEVIEVTVEGHLEGM